MLILLYLIEDVQDTSILRMRKKMLFLTAVLALNQWSYMRTGRSKIHNSSVPSVKMKYLKSFSPFLTCTDIYRKDPT